MFCFRDRASQDPTVATWGGSTVDNLESIEENDDARDADDDQVDDGKTFLHTIALFKLEKKNFTQIWR